MSNAKDNRIAQLQEQNTELHKVCIRQRESLAAQQETIVQLNMQVDGILACLCEKYGYPTQSGDGGTKHRLSFSVERFQEVLSYLQVSAVMEYGEYIITAGARDEQPREADNG